MYVMNAALELVDDQNELITVDEQGCVRIDELSGTVVIYNVKDYNMKNIGGSQHLVYNVSKVPCTIYRNLKKITVKRGSQMPWKYIRFVNN